MWRPWPRKDGVFVFVASAMVATAFWAASTSPALRALAPVLTGAALAMHARLAMGLTMAAVLPLLSAVWLVLVGAPPHLVVATTLTGLAGAVSIARYGPRIGVLRVGVGLGVLAFLSALALGLSSPGGPSGMLLLEAGAAGVGGVGSVLAMLAVEPVFAALFGHVTRRRLTDWLSFEHPLLRDLSTMAPGTLQHSVNVGVLAAEAAAAIGADALLVRVGGLYHDVGKCAAPGFFAENQDGPNPHDRLSPFESAEILRAHVTDGVSKVRAHGMGERMADFVREHHGTATMYLLRAKAEEQGPLDVGQAAAFRYTGPRPQSKETAILMLADQVEATARATHPTDAAACDDLVRRTVNRARGEDQLNDSGLTVRELSTIECTLARTVHSMYHRRLAYPETTRALTGTTSGR